MRRILAGLIAMVLLSVIFSGLALHAEGQENTTWTYMVYMAGDSSLEANVPDDIQEMQEVGSGAGLEIIVLTDKSGIDDSSVARIVSGDIQEIPITDIDSNWENEIDMGQPDTLSSYVIWAANTYPADRYVLDLWGHGIGWGGVCPDKDNYLEAHEIRTALMDVQESGIELDIVSMDACQMGMMEIAYELRGMAKYAVLSEKDVPLDGWPYDRVLQNIKDNSELTLPEFGTQMINDYYEWGLVSSRYSITLGFIDLDEISGLASAIDAYSISAANMATYFNPQFIKARSQTEEYDGNAQYDIQHLMENIFAETQCMQLKVLGDNVTAALDRAIVYERHWTNAQDEPAEHASGLSIWFPGYSPSPNYLQNGFAEDTGWDEFLAVMAPFFTSPERQEIVHGVTASPLDLDGNGLNDAVQIEWDANSVGMTIVELYGPNNELVESMGLDISSPGSQTLELEAFGSYSLATYLWGNTGELRNYSIFKGLAKEGISIISGEVTSEIGRGLAWVQISLLDGQGNILAATTTDNTGHYNLEVIVPTVTDGSNLTLVAGLGDSAQNITVQTLADHNTINFQLVGTNELVEPLTMLIAALIFAGIICLIAGMLAGRKKPEITPPKESM